MKLPRFDPRSAGDFLLHHGEKLVAAVAALVALLLVWQGVDAVRTLSVTEAQTPDAVERAATQARGHIDREANPPADLLPPRPPLADMIDPWRTPLVPWKSGTIPGLTITDAPVVAVLDNPLFDELAKRGRPDVLPLEELRATAGLAIVPVAAPAPAPAPAPPPPPQPQPEPPDRKKGGGGRVGKGGDPLAGQPDAGFPAPPDNAAPTGRVVPYVLVTGLIPVGKQQEEYRSRFENAARPTNVESRDDRPRWSDYEIDRAEVSRDGKESWMQIDLAKVAALRSAEWAALVPEKYLLGKEDDVRSKQTTPIGFCCALPPRIDGGWELADLHPWVAERLAAELAKAPAAQPQVEARGPVEAGGVDEPEPRQAEQPAPESRVELPEYRMFRFIDVTVEPGSTYRYRVRLKVRNPNHDSNPERMRPYLEDPKLALEPKLTSPDSLPTAAVKVPETTRVLVGPLYAAEVKELNIRPGTLEILVLGPSDRTGGLVLRGLMADPGAVIAIDEKLNVKNQPDRARGEPIDTGSLLLDALGRQDDAPDKAKQSAGIPEPFGVICLRQDGSFEQASLADSETWIDSYRATLPPRKSKGDAGESAPADGIRSQMPINPRTRPAGAGR